MKWLALALIPGGSLVAIVLLVRWGLDRQQEKRVSDRWLHQRRQTHGAEFPRERELS